MRSRKRVRRLQITGLLLAGIVSLWIFREVGNHHLSSFNLGLGTTVFISRGYAFFLLFWSVFGSLAALFFGGAFVVASDSDWASDVVDKLRKTSDRSAIIAMTFLGLCIPLLIRWRLLLDADIADDESAYRFMAELLVSGRLYADSPPMKLFFDRAFMINDGKFYAQYFLGWPALLAPGVALGVPWLMNPIYSALTVVPVFLTLRQLGGRRCAAIGAMIFLSAPLVQFGAATQLSHTSCIFALAWATFFAVRIYTGDERIWLHAALATSFSIAFLIRPSSALGIGLPLLAIWLISAASIEGKARWKAMAVFAAPALAFAAAFFLINMAQNGSFSTVSYQRAISYARENGFRFAAWNWFPKDRTFAMELGPIGLAAAQTGVSLTRLNYALFGWPLAFVFLPFAGWRNYRSWIPWTMFICFVVTHFHMRNGGIDTFGPVHFLETALPLVLLTALGVTRLTSSLGSVASTGVPEGLSSKAPLALCLGLITASALGYVPVRAMALHEVGSVTSLAARTAEAELQRPSVIFVPRPLIPRHCNGTHHFNFWRPNNDPDLQNRILWANHITLDHDEKLMKLYPEREAFVMVWSQQCTPRFLPLSELDAARVPPGAIGGTGELPSVEEMR